MLRLRELQPLPWSDSAKCLQADPETFFPVKGGSTREAKEICALCPVRDPCLEYALENDERHGIWGGMSEHQRRGLRRKFKTGSSIQILKESA